MKKFISLFLLLFLVVSFKANAQFSRYIIKLKDKVGSTFNTSNPLQFLSQRAIDRRARYGIAVFNQQEMLQS
jgi:serine protease AprX